ncbi:MAG: hypothetical protein PVI86_09740 [Phycisphaerae bacterium]
MSRRPSTRTNGLNTTAPITNAAVLAAAAFFHPPAFAGYVYGTVGFEPPEVTIDPLVDPTVFTLETYVATASPENFAGLALIIGVDGGPQLIGFEWADFTRFFDSVSPYDEDYDSGWVFSYFGPSQQVGLTLGTWTVDVTGVDVGDYEVEITSEGTWDCPGFPPCSTWTGAATIHVVPEPGMFVLMTVAACLGSRRSIRTSMRRP